MEYTFYGFVKKINELDNSDETNKNETLIWNTWAMFLIIHVLCAFVVIWCCLGIIWCVFCVIWCAFVILWYAFGFISDVLLSLRCVILLLLIKRLLEVSTKISITGKHNQKQSCDRVCKLVKNFVAFHFIFSVVKEDIVSSPSSHEFGLFPKGNTMRIFLLTHNRTKWIFQTLFKGTFEIL